MSDFMKSLGINPKSGVESYAPSWEQIIRQKSANPQAYLTNTPYLKYKDDGVAWVNKFVWTYDPRLVEEGQDPMLKMTLRPKQVELWEFLEEKLSTGENGLVEKSRDEGMTWVVCAFMVHKWLFKPGFKAGIGSRKKELVDQSGNMDSIFEKIRFLLDHLPDQMIPPKFQPRIHMKLCRIINPSNNAALTGEGGDEIGRGGRNSMYFVDEHASLENPDAAEAALSQNTNCIIYGSTPKGPNNLFARKRRSGKIDVFTLWWRDNPKKNYTESRINSLTGKREIYYPWREDQDKKYDPEINRQELDLDYTVSGQNVLIRSEWIEAAMSMQLKQGHERVAGLDVSDEGGDFNTMASRAGGVVFRIRQWKEKNTTLTARSASQFCIQDRVDMLFYDKVGVGAGVKGTLEEDDKEKALPFGIMGINNGTKPSLRRFSDDMKLPASERFRYFGGELGWALRLRFLRTYERSMGIAHHPDEECISLWELRNDPLMPELKLQLSQPTYVTMDSGKLHVSKLGEGDKSPDLYEALVNCFGYKKLREKPSSGSRIHNYASY